MIFSIFEEDGSFGDDGTFGDAMRIVVLKGQTTVSQ